MARLKYIVTHVASPENMLGEYDKTTNTYYITVQGFNTIAKELGIDKKQLIDNLVKAGVMEKGTIPYYSKVTKSTIRVYKVKFPENSMLEQQF